MRDGGFRQPQLQAHNPRPIHQKRAEEKATTGRIASMTNHDYAPAHLSSVALGCWLRRRKLAHGPTFPVRSQANIQQLPQLCAAASIFGQHPLTPEADIATLNDITDVVWYIDNPLA